MNQEKSNNGIHVIIAGGTLDFHSNPNYERQQDQVDLLVPRKESIVPRFLQNRVKIASDEILFSRACLKDSREINDDDLTAMDNLVKSSPYEKVLITHGILNMGETKAYLETTAAEQNKSVGIVGSRMPLSEYRSDAGFNLGYAIAKMQSEERGIHTFHPDNIRDSVSRLLEKDLAFILTGGTIDSAFNEQVDTATPYTKSVVPSYFTETLGIQIAEPSFVFREICMKDSRELRPEDIGAMMQESVNQSHKAQLLTAGTYALPDLATRYEKLVADGEMPKSKYTFVGAMLPEDVMLADGPFNLGYAIGKQDAIKPGVHVAMHAWATAPSNVLKQLQEARFDLYNRNQRV